MTDLITPAAAAALAKMHHDRTGKLYAGRPFFDAHVAAVADEVRRMYDEEITDATADERRRALVLAYVHDLVEDTDVTLAELRAIGYDEEMLLDVDAITYRRGHELRRLYIDRCCRRRIARRVKIADNRVNARNVDTLPEDRREGLRRRYERERGLLAAAELEAAAA